MTFKQKHKENIKLISLYDSFLMAIEISFDDRINLITEIGRLNQQNNWIKGLMVKEYDAEMNDYKIKIPSEWIK